MEVKFTYSEWKILSEWLHELWQMLIYSTPCGDSECVPPRVHSCPGNQSTGCPGNCVLIPFSQAGLAHPECHANEIAQLALFSVMTFLRLSHIIVGISCPFLFIDGKYSSLWTDHILFVYLLADAHCISPRFWLMLKNFPYFDEHFFILYQNKLNYNLYFMIWETDFTYNVKIHLLWNLTCTLKNI